MATNLTADLALLDKSFEDTLEKINAKINWYSRHIWPHRIGSTLIRICAFIALAYGILSPLIRDPHSYQAAYSSLVVGGLILMLDQLFLMTGSWTRYVSAKLALETTADQLTANWRVLRAAADPDVKPYHTDALKLFAESLSAADAIQAAELTKWQGELETAVKKLAENLDAAQKQVGEKRDKYESEQAEAKKKEEQDAAADKKANQDGALNVTVTATSEALKDLVVSFNGKTQQAGKLPDRRASCRERV